MPTELTRLLVVCRRILNLQLHENTSMKFQLEPSFRLEMFYIQFFKWFGQPLSLTYRKSPDIYVTSLQSLERRLASISTPKTPSLTRRRSSPGKDEVFPFFHSVQTSSGAHQTSYPMSTNWGGGEVSRKKKRPGCKAGHLKPVPSSRIREFIYPVFYIPSRH
jgi:hypothetical protein